ncbi:hypothetical protein [Bacteroides bouchesdurhonensis]|uniref:hypothetical protein n=1 Tax=Bacteroides bouchesdurhonensis TaxID=1841855 RepID=UPI00135670CB|nr:hypothetical protein [Bacteroides bouchesdurhonensis]
MTSGHENVLDYVIKQAPANDLDQKHIHWHVFKDVDVEAHWIPVKRGSRKFDRVLDSYFVKECDRQMGNGGSQQWIFSWYTSYCMCLVIMCMKAWDYVS